MSAARVLGIVGTGLIGGSIGLRAREHGWHVVGFDASESAIQEALASGAIDECAARERLYARADAIVIAAHVAGTIAELRHLRDEPPQRAAFVADVASVKVPVLEAAAGVAAFVGTHPLAGSERSGARAARAALFEGRPWAYVPSSNPELDERVRAFIVSMGAAPVAVEADSHDRAVAFTSHLPQVVATLFTRAMRERADSHLEALCGPVARELLRLGNSSPAMWNDILQANRAWVAPELRALAAELERAAADLNGADA